MDINFKVTRSLVHHLLTAATCVGPWSIQGFGMLRLYLPDNMRLHVWSDEYRVTNNAHDHTWDFTSLVISGQINDLLYTENYHYFEDLTDEKTHLMQEIHPGAGGGIKTSPREVRLHEMENIVVRAGESYTRTHRQLHMSVPSDGCVTIIQRTPRDENNIARVAVPIGQTFSFVEPRPATDDEVMAITSNALARWNL